MGIEEILNGVMGIAKKLLIYFQVIVVLLNIGHKASHMPAPEFPFTHDWSAYVQGGEGIDIKHFVEKVIFKLHETFTNPVQGLF